MFSQPLHLERDSLGITSPSPSPHLLLEHAVFFLPLLAAAHWLFPSPIYLLSRDVEASHAGRLDSLSSSESAISVVQTASGGCFVV